MNKTRSQSREQKLIIIIFTISNHKRNQGDELNPLNVANIWSKLVVHRYLWNGFFNLYTYASLWRRSRWATLFCSFFLDIVYIFTLEKIIAQWGCLHPFLYSYCSFGQIFCTKVIQFFFCGKYRTLGTQIEQQIWLSIFLDSFPKSSASVRPLTCSVVSIL